MKIGFVLAKRFLELKKENDRAAAWVDSCQNDLATAQLRLETNQKQLSEFSEEAKKLGIDIEREVNLYQESLPKGEAIKEYASAPMPQGIITPITTTTFWEV